MKLSIYCDGGSRGNPGPAAIGFVVYQDGEKIKTFSQKVGRTTNNVAEYQAVITALRWLSESPEFFSSSQKTIVNFYLDSELVGRQLLGLYKVKDTKLKTLIIEVKNLEKKISGQIFYHFVSRNKNKLADLLVNQALDKKSYKE